MNSITGSNNHIREEYARDGKKVRLTATICHNTQQYRLTAEQIEPKNGSEKRILFSKKEDTFLKKLRKLEV